tara:strand:+ start:316 stop:498 length:183 start_codon:yes stop_codon:yes gene_type:complete
MGHKVYVSGVRQVPVGIKVAPSNFKFLKKHNYCAFLKITKAFFTSPWGEVDAANSGIGCG